MTSSAVIRPAPVRKTIHVKAAPERAFVVFTRDIGRWWPRTHSIGASPIATATIEPKAGGRWFETGDDGSLCDWGHVVAWEPPHRLVLAWQIGADWRFDPALVTEVEVTFTAEGDGTTVRLEHRDLERIGTRGDEMRAIYDSEGGWTGILALYGAAV